LWWHLFLFFCTIIDHAKTDLPIAFDSTLYRSRFTYSQIYDVTCSSPNFNVSASLLAGRTRRHPDFSAQPLIDYHATEHHMQLEECINNNEWLAYDIPRTQINILNM
jgi:hypothetical protein